MCQSVNLHNIREMTKEIEQTEMRLKAFMPRSITLPLSSTSSATGGSASGPSETEEEMGQHRRSSIQ